MIPTGQENKMNDSAFEQWYNGMVGFHINSERILDDFGMHGDDAHLVRKWMVVCWNSAIDAAINEVIDLATCDDLEKLKEKI